MQPEAGLQRPSPPPSSPTPNKLPAVSQAIGVLTIGEAAGRLSMTRRQLETMIERGEIQAVPTGFTRMIPTAEVERLKGTK